jgi:hypothetical protein
MRVEVDRAMNTFHSAEPRINETEPPGVVHGGVLDGSGPWRPSLQTTRNVGWTGGEVHSSETATWEGDQLVGHALLRQTDVNGHMFPGEDELQQLPWTG